LNIQVLNVQDSILNVQDSILNIQDAILYIQDSILNIQDKKYLQPCPLRGSVYDTQVFNMQSQKLNHWLLPRWLRGRVVERWFLTGELSLSCARPVADG